MSNDRRGLLFIVSAPSGAGKTTLVERLVEQLPNLKMSRSYTSRRAREGEASETGQEGCRNLGHADRLLLARAR